MSMSLASNASISIDPKRLPKHVAIIMDGNRRWAKERGLPAIEGHRRGILALREITRAASDLGIEIVTVYGFSTENWRRDAREISLLLDLAVYFAKNELSELQKNNVRVELIGDWEALPGGSRNALAQLREKTAQNTGLVLNLAVNYSSRSELEHAMRAIARDVAAGRLRPDEIDDECIGTHLYTRGVPDPDLLIRPGGEQRLSNFLLYQVAYTELVMSEVYWPAFSREDLVRAIVEYQRRHRRLGT